MTTPALDPDTEARFLAAVDLIGRTGAAEFQFRFSDDEMPVVWIAVAGYGDGEHFQVGASVHPLRAVLLLLESLVDGGTCTHCARPTGVEPDSFEAMPADQLICWYQYDPELKTFRRGCEGDGR